MAPTLLKTLASYVPALILQRVATEHTPLRAPATEQFDAVVLYADVLGFTALAEQFAQRGPGGHEELTRLLNAYVGQLVDLVGAHGGDVVKFAGDALVALWAAKEEPLPTAAWRAAQCASVIQTRFHEYQVAEEVRLSLRVGLGAGEVSGTHLGGVFGRWEFLLTGEPLVQMSLAEQQAQPGEVVFSAEAWTLVQEVCEGQPLPTGGVRLLELTESHPLRPLMLPPLTPEMESPLRAYLPGAILARLSAGHQGWLAELRRVTVLFINLPNLNHTAPLDHAQRVMCTLQEMLYHHEGSVNKLSVDDKGTTLVAALGLPPLAHEDDAVRGVQAALAMHATLEKLGEQNAIGVATGWTFCGSLGSERRREYTMVGDVVNMAARLMQADTTEAPCICDEATYLAAHARFTFERLPPMMLKGKAEPVPLFQPLTKIPRTIRPQTALVNRRAERALLLGRVQALLHGDAGGIILLEGEAGIGKSRLLSLAIQQAERFALPCLVGAGDAVERGTPYHAWRPLLRRLLGIEGTAAEVELRRSQALSHLALEPEYAERLPLLNSILPLELPENEMTSQMRGQTRADNTRDLLLHLLERALAPQEQPLLLVMEDAHWLDSASWALLLAFIQRVQPMLLLLALRPLIDPPEEYQQLIEAPTTYRLRLEALSKAESVALICQRLGVSAVPEVVADLIHERAEGRPFFCEEMAYALRDGGLLRIVAGECQLVSEEALRTLTIPETIQGIITSRIDQLRPTEQLALKSASVIGRAFSFQTLHDIYPIQSDTPNLAPALARLVHLDILRVDPEQPQTDYWFKHAITQEVAYNLMLFSQRRQLHRVVAEWYEQHTAPDDMDSFYPLLAHHWGQADVQERAAYYLEKAGEQALRDGAYQEAAYFFQELLVIRQEGGSDLRRAHWERQLGEAYFGLGKLAESREHLERAVALLGRQVPPTSSLLTFNLIRRAGQHLAHRLRAERGGEEEEQARLESARAYERLASMHYWANERLPTLHAVLSMVTLAERSTPTPELARAYASMCLVAGTLPLHPLAESYRRRAKKIAQELGQLASLAWVLLVTGSYAIGVGQWQSVEEEVGEAVDLYRRLADQRGWGDGLVVLAYSAYFQGDFEQWVRRSDELYHLARRSNNRQHQGWALVARAMQSLRRDEPVEAVAKLESAMALLGVNQLPGEEIAYRGALALARLRQGEAMLALVEAESARHLIEESQPTTFAAFEGYAGVAEVYLFLWESKGAAEGFTSALPTFQATARQACAALREFARVFPVAEPRSWLWQGLYEWLSGSPQMALRAWRKSLAIAQRLGMPYEAALAHYELGRHLAPEDADRQGHLDQASAYFRGQNATFDLARVQAVMSGEAGSALLPPRP